MRLMLSIIVLSFSFFYCLMLWLTGYFFALSLRLQFFIYFPASVLRGSLSGRLSAQFNTKSYRNNTAIKITQKAYLLTKQTNCQPVLQEEVKLSYALTGLFDNLSNQGLYIQARKSPAITLPKIMYFGQKYDQSDFILFSSLQTLALTMIPPPGDKILQKSGFFFDSGKGVGFVYPYAS
ncbi:hypothetical protein FGO68_gene13398 [Halteria grandinella]|uniref:Uncharacterized protein n=1 Tax=Halteria grandinella TaxID=5974 RepID=A0A8J8NA83_HALGN|nr:hypothetical protein FGO68_gene13398 [Halteria grandinella]